MGSTMAPQRSGHDDAAVAGDDVAHRERDRARTVPTDAQHGVGTAGDVVGTDWDAIGRQMGRGRIGTPEDIAGLAIYLASRAGAFTVGDIITCDGGIVVS